MCNDGAGDVGPCDQIGGTPIGNRTTAITPTLSPQPTQTLSIQDIAICRNGVGDVALCEQIGGTPVGSTLVTITPAFNPQPTQTPTIPPSVEPHPTQIPIFGVVEIYDGVDGLAARGQVDGRVIGEATVTIMPAMSPYPTEPRSAPTQLVSLIPQCENSQRLSTQLVA